MKVCKSVQAILLLVNLILLMNCTENFNDDNFERDINFNKRWKFLRCGTNTIDSNFYRIDFDDGKWETVELPHSPKIEPLVVNNQWQGICWYRKKFNIDKKYSNSKIFIEFEGAMQVADVWVNGTHKVTNYGGYLPFIIDITDDIYFDKENVIAVRLDNRDNPEIPPGKPLKYLDFCYYGGLYRNVKMHILNKIHITDPIFEDIPAGGGIFVRYPFVSKDSARVWVKTHIRNESIQKERIKLVTKLIDNEDDKIILTKEESVDLNPGESEHIIQSLLVKNPKLWHPYHPHLYNLKSELWKKGKKIDEVTTRIGIRKIKISREGFFINGEKMFINGTNRHQEYPYVGNAVPDNCHYRDAYKIKMAGFDFVRLSHYPQADAFLNACDELGILVMDAIPGWQFFGNEVFQKRSLNNIRKMIRKDRNHPSVIIWEASLNESQMSVEFMKKAHRTAHEEYPGSQCYTAGWQDTVYDVFIPARQHARKPFYWKYYKTPRPMFIAEYGDWEYYAQNAGFNQPEFKNLKPEERTSRQFRADGERRLLQQALNFQEAFNDIKGWNVIGCSNWVMFDYNRGYSDDIESSGVMDIFRLPKFVYYFYRSQREPNINELEFYRPFVFIASFWNKNSKRFIKVFSNCDSVKLKLNNKEIKKFHFEEGFSENLEHPPYIFELEKFVPGRLEAIGYINGSEVAKHLVVTPGHPQFIDIVIDFSGRKPDGRNKDILLIHAVVKDRNGMALPDYSKPVRFEVIGSGQLIGKNPINAEAGIATILLEVTTIEGNLTLRAESGKLKGEIILGENFGIVK